MPDPLWNRGLANDKAHLAGGTVGLSFNEARDPRQTIHAGRRITRLARMSSPISGLAGDQSAITWHFKKIMDVF
jgi:hypothetical protein